MERRSFLKSATAVGVTAAAQALASASPHPPQSLQPSHKT